MATVKKWGAGQDENRNVPSLSDWVQAGHPIHNNDSFQVVKVNKSDKWDCYTFQCVVEGKTAFRANLYEGTEEYDIFTEHFRQWRESKTPVYLVIVDEEFDKWTVGTGEEGDATWQKKGAGFICSIVKSKDEPETLT